MPAGTAEQSPYAAQPEDSAKDRARRTAVKRRVRRMSGRIADKSIFVDPEKVVGLYI
jgi:hypothetical protein